MTDRFDSFFFNITAPRPRILNALVQRGTFNGFVVITTDEWAEATTDASKQVLLSGKLAGAWGGQKGARSSRSSSSSTKKKRSSSSSSKSKVTKGV